MSEVHITSCVAYARPDHVDAVVRAIRDTNIAEVPRQDANGRFLLLIERGSTGQVLDVIDAVRALDGVLAVHLAYQHVEDESELQEPHE